MVNMPTVYILGAGAIGKALAVFLKHAHRNVVLVRTSTDKYALREETLRVELPEGITLQETVTVGALSDFSSFEGFIVLTNKAFANEAIAQRLNQIACNAPLIVMQNGLHVEKPFMKRFDTVYRCVLFATSQPVDSHTIRFKPVQPSPVGIVKGDAALLGSIINTLDTEYFRFQSNDNIQPVIWRKTIANCVFNSICPLLETDNGVFHRNAEARQLATRVIHECLWVAQEVGLQLNADDILNTVLMISRASDGHLISTLQDIHKGRDTEIESLNFAVVALAADRNKREMVAETKLLGELTRLKAFLHKRPE